MSTSQTSRRRGVKLVPKRELKLVRKGEQWAICFKASGRLDGQPGKVLAWLREHDETFFAEVGEGSVAFDLPEPTQRNFFDDQFTFAIDETDAKGGRVQYLGGANNVTAATAAFHAYLKTMPPQRYVMLRQGGRVLLRGHDLKVIDD